MRLLHTSDWHLGQTLQQFDRSAEHQHFLDWLCQQIQAQDADGLLIAGDVFDTANPSAAAQKMFYRFLQQARAIQPHLQIVVIAGNHDSPGRLESALPLLEQFNTHVIGFVPRLQDGSIDLDKLILPLRDRHGVTRAFALALPFLRQSDVPRVEDAADPYMAGIGLLYQQVQRRALELRTEDQVIVALGHCHLIGGQVSAASERSIVIGGSEALSASIFDSRVAYVALGHLHLAQQVSQQQHIRYCGSPLALSFAETEYLHQILRVDLDCAQLASVTPLPVPRTVPMLRVMPQPAPLAQVLEALRQLDLPATDYPPYLQVRVRLQEPEPAIRSLVEQALEGKTVRLVRIEVSYATATRAQDELSATQELAQLSPQEMFERLYHSQYQEAPPLALRQALNELIHGAAQ
ncbi:exonuclease SbcCD subunit D C-terminal domain-containing protein [Undibacterium sp. CY7W]|uniref:Nuclease SbcCD subunit D n=1 Tax=Undibacterium rugosum TaxID=2762291 RepID=A0A923I1I5_9BURK|nr:exonuclease SbcCD subunit D C-terminal domain-containing protein [Undibacterium rugosum]MBC3934782.1 exonuclease SbcCD subunit D C-terminal domain-containing protein [Undibacterium rugosum]